jgi:hypothetical protein
VWRSYGHETGAAWFLASCGPAVFIIYLSVCFSTWSNCQPAFHHQHPTLHRTVSGLNGSRTQTLSEPAAMHTLFVWIPLSQYISSSLYLCLYLSHSFPLSDSLSSFPTSIFPSPVPSFYSYRSISHVSAIPRCTSLSLWPSFYI